MSCQNGCCGKDSIIEKCLPPQFLHEALAEDYYKQAVLDCEDACHDILKRYGMQITEMKLEVAPIDVDATSKYIYEMVEDMIEADDNYLPIEDSRDVIVLVGPDGRAQL